MKVTDIIRGLIDLIDSEAADSVEAPALAPEPELDAVVVMQRLAGLEQEPEYANEPNEVVAPFTAAFPGGNDMHAPKNPADIRTNAPSMFPGFQAGVQ